VAGYEGVFSRTSLGDKATGWTCTARTPPHVTRSYEQGAAVLGQTPVKTFIV